MYIKCLMSFVDFCIAVFYLFQKKKNEPLFLQIVLLHISSLVSFWYFLIYLIIWYITWHKLLLSFFSFFLCFKLHNFCYPFLNSQSWTHTVILLRLVCDYAILLFTASDFTSLTSHIHNWVLFLLWLQLFILSGVISPLISNSILDDFRPGEWSFSVLSFCLFLFFAFFPFKKSHACIATLSSPNPAATYVQGKT